MQALVGIAALAAFSYGLAMSLRPATPLFFRIVTLGFGCYALGAGYDALRMVIISTNALPELAFAPGALDASSAGAASSLAMESGLSIGLFGYAGLFFFLGSSYYGALDSLADGHEPAYRPYRAVGLLVPAAIGAMAAALCVLGALSPLTAAALLPVAFTAYFAAKHLVIPDVEFGIIRVMRPYNACILVLCLAQPAALITLGDSLAHAIHLAALAATALATFAALPLAHRGVAKWFI